MNDNTSNRFTYRGRVHALMPVQTFSSGFKKRDLVCETVNGEYTDRAVFAAKKDLADRIATLKPGDEVSVTFVLDGHAWEDPRTQQTRWFGGATALKVELAGGVNAGSLNAPPAAEPAPATIESTDCDDMPF